MHLKTSFVGGPKPMSDSHVLFIMVVSPGFTDEEMNWKLHKYE